MNEPKKKKSKMQKGKYQILDIWDLWQDQLCSRGLGYFTSPVLQSPIHIVSLLGCLSFIPAAYLSRYLDVLTSPTPWSPQCSSEVTSAELCTGLSGPPCRDFEPVLHSLASVATGNHGVILHNFVNLVSFMCAIAMPCEWCYYFLLPIPYGT